MDERQRILEEFLVAHPEVPGVLLHIDGPDGSWSGAAGLRDHHKQDPLEPGDTIRIASITKSFAGASVLRLCESGRIRLDDPIGEWVNAELRHLLGPEKCEEITILALLSHTSGLCDFVWDTDYRHVVMSDLHRQWSREDQVRYAMTHGEDVGRPGEKFHYSDTGYSLIGGAIEMATGLGLAESYRSLLPFEELGLTSTYLESLEPVAPLAGPRACQYAEGQDTCDANPSFGIWGGGGLVSTVADAARFMRGLFEHRVFDSAETLARMIEPVKLSDEGVMMGLGIGGRNVDGGVLYGHGGYWGAYAGFLPHLGVAFSVAALERSAIEALGEEMLPRILAYVETGKTLAP